MAATALGAGIALTAVHVGADYRQQRRGGRGSDDPVPAAMAAHRACLARGESACHTNTVGSPRAEAADASRCPMKWPRKYGMNREQVERIAEQVPSPQR